MEIWKTIPEFEDYEINRFGVVRRNKDAPTGIAKKGYIYKTKIMPNGYCVARLNKGGKTYNLLTHRLIAELFLEKPENYKELNVNHKNGVRNDNRPENLEWVTQSENMMHSRDVLKSLNPPRGEKQGKSKLTNNDVIEIRNLYSMGVLQKDIAKKFDVSAKQISVIARKIQWAHI